MLSNYKNYQKMSKRQVIDRAGKIHTRNFRNIKN